MSKKKYKIEKKIFQKIYNKLQNIIGSLNVLECYCECNKYSEDIQNIYPVFKYAYKETDSIFLYFIDMDAMKK